MELAQRDWIRRLRQAKRVLPGFLLGAVVSVSSLYGQVPGPDPSSVSTPNTNSQANASLPPNIGTQATGGIKPGEAADDTFFEILFSGGPLGGAIMVALILMSILAMYLVIDQWLTLRRKDLMPNDLNENVRQLLSQGKLKDADQACRSQPCPLSYVLASGIAEIEYGWPAVEKSLEDALAEQAARMYRKLEYLSVIGNLAPMLGLLGTVAGMILAFREVALSQGTAGAGQLASGIYSALVTTVAGLLIAIPSLGAFAVFRNRIDEIISEMATAAQQAFGPIRRRLPGGGASRPTAVPPPRG